MWSARGVSVPHRIVVCHVGLHRACERCVTRRAAVPRAARVRHCVAWGSSAAGLSCDAVHAKPRQVAGGGQDTPRHPLKSKHTCTSLSAQRPALTSGKDALGTQLVVVGARLGVPQQAETPARTWPACSPSTCGISTCAPSMHVKPLEPMGPYADRISGTHVSRRPAIPVPCACGEPCWCLAGCNSYAGAVHRRAPSATRVLP